MNRPALLAMCCILACCIHVLRAAEPDSIRERLEGAKATYASKLEALRNDVLADLDKNENAARQAPDKKRIDEIKAQRKAFEATGQLPTPLNPQLLARIHGARAALEKEYLLARDLYLKKVQ